MKKKNEEFVTNKNFIRFEAKKLSDDIFTSEIYQLLYDMATDKKFNSKFHRKAFNHLTKSIKRLDQIYEGDK